MSDSYPYIISNNKIEPILTRIRTAARPERFTSTGTLKTWGFTASNDRAMVTILKELGFLNEGGVPTEYYDRLKDPNDWKYVLGERIRDLYSDLFAINENIATASESEIKGAFSRITGKDDETIKRYYATFKTLVGLAKFEAKPTRTTTPPDLPEPKPTDSKPKQQTKEENPLPRAVEYHYNIQIHLPVTTDITVYNAIFKSLKENLGL